MSSTISLNHCSIQQSLTPNLYLAQTPDGKPVSIRVGNRALAEIKIWQRLQQIPLPSCILSPLHYEENDPFPYLVYPWKEGSNLQTLLDNSQPTPIRTIQTLFVTSLKQLHLLHNKGITHAHIHPKNFLLCKIKTDTRSLMLSGFDKAFSQSPHAPWSSPQYLAPEVLSQISPIDYRIDLFALAALVAELITKTPLFPFKDASQDTWPHLIPLQQEISQGTGPNSLHRQLQPHMQKDSRYKAIYELLKNMLDPIPENRPSTLKAIHIISCQEEIRNIIVQETSYTPTTLTVRRNLRIGFVKNANQKTYFLKQQISHLSPSLKGEIEILQYLQQRNANTTHLTRMAFHQLQPLHTILLERFPGTNLEAFYKRQIGHFSLSDMQSITKQCLLAIQELHSHLLVHADIKPTNFLIHSKNQTYHIVLCDFDLTFPIDKPRYCGTSFFQAPEILTKNSIGYPIDLFALGASLVETYTHTPLFPLPHTPPYTYLDKIAEHMHVLDCPYPARLLAALPTPPATCPTRHTLRELLPRSAKAEESAFHDLLDQMLICEPEERISAQKALSHHFLQEEILPLQKKRRCS